ncbi:unnamed protein product [Caenorhabditis brenneri]
MKVFLLFTVLITAAFSKKLTPEEDEQRAKTCGRVKKPAHDLPQYHAPWVATYLNGGPSSWFKGSFLISDYHMITNSELTMRSKHIQCINITPVNFQVNRTQISKVRNKKPKVPSPFSATVLISHGNYRDDHNVWEWYMQGEGTVNINDCKDGVIKLPESQVRLMMAKFRCDGHCGTNGYSYIKSAHYVGNCKHGKPPMGILILEFTQKLMEAKVIWEERDGKMMNHFENSTVIPICLPGKTNVINIGDIVEEQSGQTSNLEVHIYKQNQTIVNCRNSEGGRLMCVNDTMYGDGFVKKFDGADTLLGLSFGKEDEKALYTPHIGVSLTYYKDKICEITGVCKDTIIEKPTEAPKTSDSPDSSDENSSSNIFGIMELLILIVLVYLK